MGMGNGCLGRTMSAAMIPIIALTASSQRASANGTICVAGPGGEVEVCVSWSQAVKPDPDSDFLVEFADPFSPTVTLKTGDPDWNIVVTDLTTAEAGNLTAVLIDPATSTSSYGVSLLNGFEPAVHHIGDIALVATGWNGYSNLTGATIGGNIEGSIKVQQSPFGLGGRITGNVFAGGDLIGDIFVPWIEDAWVIIAGDVQGGVTVTEAIVDSTVDFGGDVGAGSTIDLFDLQGYAVVVIGSASNYPFGEFDGLLNLRSGLPEGAEFYVWNRLSEVGVVDFNGGKIKGRFELEAGGGGQLVNGGVVTSGGHLWVSSGSENTFTGTATFAGIEPFGAVEAEYSNIDGTINILGDMNGYLWVRVGPLLENGKFYVAGNVGNTGSINVASASEFGGDVLGLVRVDGEMRGNITVDGTVSGEISAASLIGGGQYWWSGLVDIAEDVDGTVAFDKVHSFGQIHVSGNVSGELQLGKMESGSVGVDADLSGLINVWDSLVGGSIYVVQNVTASGHVNVAQMGEDGAYITLGSGEIGQYEMEGKVDLHNGVPFNSSLSITSESGPNGVIDLHHGDIVGSIVMDGGGYGQLTNGGIIRENGHVWVATGDAVWRGRATFDGSDQWGTVDAEAGDVDGIVEFLGDHNGQVVIRGGSLFSNGQILFRKHVGPTGRMLLYSAFGDDGNCDGRIGVRGNMNGEIQVDGRLSSTGIININGSHNGTMTVELESQAGSNINARYLASGAYIVINDSAGPHDADGNITIGSAFSPTPGAVFDGCIRVRKQSTGGFGDLNGNISVWGCHATADPLNICIDGNVNGSINIFQSGCPNQVTWTCGGCP